MPNRTRTLLFATAALAACVSAPAANATDPVGCWYFERDEAAVALNLPWGIRLADEALTGWPAIDARGGGHVARTLNQEGEAQHPFGYWLAIGADSVEVGYPAGGGIVLRLARGDTSMQGIAREVGDVGTGARPERHVRLTRAACPA